MDKYVSINSYKGGRSTLLAVVILTAVNVFLACIDAHYSLLFSAILPQIAVGFAQNFSGFEQFLIIFIFAMIPVLLLGICYLLSKKDWKWMLVASILMSIDALALVAYSIFIYFDGYSVSSFFFEGIILFVLIRSTKSGKRLNNDFEEPKQEEVVNEAVDKQTQAEETDEHIKVYMFDKALAKQNKTDKTWWYVLSILVFLVVEIGLCLIAVFASSLGILSGILAIVAMVGYIYIVVKMAPFVSCNSYSYFKKDDCVCRVSSQTLVTSQVFANLLVEKETSNAYYCSYISQNGKTRKLVIPKCYPNIEEILY